MTTIPKSIQNHIYLIRDQRVLLDEDLANLYQVDSRSLVQAVKRNAKRFPVDFMFKLSSQEYKVLRSQFVISTGKTGCRHSPQVFTEQGIAILSGVLQNDRTIEVNIEIIRTFVRLRYILAEHKDLKFQLTKLEERYGKQFQVVFEVIESLKKKELNLQANKQFSPHVATMPYAKEGYLF